MTIMMGIGSWTGGVRCTRCCLHLSLRVVNFVVNMIGVGMIIYSLWLLKKWNYDVAQLPATSRSDLPRPWFIYACLGVGMIVSLSAVFGHMVANCITNSILCTYILSISSIILLQTGVVIAIFFKMDMSEEIIKYIDADHARFKSFVIFHICMCKFTTIMVLVAQVSVVALAAVLWAVGKKRVTSHCNLLGPIRGSASEFDHFRYSFLIPDHAPSSASPLLIPEYGTATLATNTIITTTNAPATMKLDSLLLNITTSST